MIDRLFIIVLAVLLFAGCRRPPVATVTHTRADTTLITDSAVARRALLPVPQDRASLVFRLECKDNKPLVFPAFYHPGKIIAMQHVQSGDLLNVSAATIDSATVAVEWIERHREIVSRYSERVETPVIIKTPLSWWQKFVQAAGYIAIGFVLLKIVQILNP